MAEENIHTDLALPDIHLMLQIIDICAKRGAFQPDEFVAVGGLSRKLKGVVTKAALDEPEHGEPEFQPKKP